MDFLKIALINQHTIPHIVEAKGLDIFANL
jgi:hypothetical protein